MHRTAAFPWTLMVRAISITVSSSQHRHQRLFICPYQKAESRRLDEGAAPMIKINESFTLAFWPRPPSRSSISPTWIRLVVAVHPGCTNLELGPRSDHKGNSMFVHHGCTNPGLRRRRETSRKLRARESTGPVTDLRLLGRYGDVNRVAPCPILRCITERSEATWEPT